jgi:putative oxidoreductase
MNFSHSVFDTRDTLAPLIARVALGIVIMPHGMQKLFGLWDGNGFNITMENFQAGEGFEYHLLAVALGSIVMITGSGRWALDSLLNRHLTKR